MAIADDMKSITEDIITSYDLRVKAVGDLMADTHEILKNARATLKGVASERKEMSKEQASRLAAFASDLTRSVDTMLKEFHKNHKEMSDVQAKNLVNFVKDLTENVGLMLSNLQKDRSEMSADLKKRLKKTVKEIESYTKNKLKEFSDAHADMSEELKKDLAKFTGDIQREVKKLLGEYAVDMKKAANAWQGMSNTLATARKGRAVIPKVETKVKVMPVEEAIEEVIEEEVPVEEGLEERVLEFINSHPEGIRVGDMEEPLGVARTKLGKIAKSLLEAGEVRKEENLYFPL